MQELEMISHLRQLPWENLEGTSQTQMVNNCVLYMHTVQLSDHKHLFQNA